MSWSIWYQYLKNFNFGGYFLLPDHGSVPGCWRLRSRRRRSGGVHSRVERTTGCSTRRESGGWEHRVRGGRGRTPRRVSLKYQLRLNRQISHLKEMTPLQSLLEMWLRSRPPGRLELGVGRNVRCRAHPRNYGRVWDYPVGALSGGRVARGRAAGRWNKESERSEISRG